MSNESQIQNFRVEFGRPGAIYMSGESVTGKVILELSDVLTNIREISSEIRGDAEVYWSNVDHTSDSDDSNTCTGPAYYKSSEHYFRVSNLLIDTTNAEEPIALQPGQHCFHFSFQLPTNIPCSFEHDVGHVRYIFKAIIDRDGRVDRKIISAFTVLTHYDLNTHQELTMGVTDYIERSIQSWSCLGNESIIKIKVKSRFSGFVPGETIELFIIYKTNSARLKNVKLTLHKILDFYASSPSRTKKQNNICIETVQRKISRRGPYSKIGLTCLKIKVPSLPPSNLKHCSIINVTYKLNLHLHISGQHYEKRSYPIEIGTKPIDYQKGQDPVQSLLLPLAASAPTIEQINADSRLPLQATGPIGFESMNEPYVLSERNMTTTNQRVGITASSRQPMPVMLPPSYEECVTGSNYIVHRNEEGIHGPMVRFSPKYPVYKLPMHLRYYEAETKASESSHKYDVILKYQNQSDVDEYETDYDDKHVTHCIDNEHEEEDARGKVNNYDNKYDSNCENNYDNKYDSNCENNYDNKYDSNCENNYDNKYDSNYENNYDYKYDSICENNYDNKSDSNCENNYDNKYDSNCDNNSDNNHDTNCVNNYDSNNDNYSVNNYDSNNDNYCDNNYDNYCDNNYDNDYNNGD